MADCFSLIAWLGGTAQGEPMENETDAQKIKRLETAMELISFLQYRKDMHLGRPRLSDMNCIFCVAQLSKDYGAFGDYLTTEMMEAKIAQMREAVTA
jgi:hypothetical protein